ncbi:MAG: cysteine desulfurase [Nitrospirae bacterium]|nr:cysteine desulfurase [Candidatus Manganitrophaceae bacterium]
MKKIYLDHIAATPLLPAAREAMLPFFAEHFGNPQSRHAAGEVPRKALEEARKRVAELIGADPREIVFTGSGSEANNLAIKGVLSARQKKGRHIITSSIEHFSVAHPLKHLEQEGFEVTWLPVDRQGRVQAAQVSAALREETVLVSILHANNEIGTVQPIEAIAAITQEAGVLFHTDAVATVGVIPFQVDSLGIDLASFSAQPFYGPKGAGALYLRRGTRLHPLIEGGIQEGGRRSGTENVAAIVGMGVAAMEAKRRLSVEAPRLAALRDRLVVGLRERVPLLHPTGDPIDRLPHIASFAVEFVDGEALIRKLEKRGIMAASGSSCSAEALKISPVLTATGLPGNIAQGGIVFSLGMETTEADIEAVLTAFPAAVDEIRQVSPIYSDVSPRKERE